jgi:hypothetical protein
MNERRQSPRRSAEDASLTFPSSMGVKVLDISVSGVLVESSTSVPLGTRGGLRLNLGGTPITLEVQIQRVDRETPGSACRLGAKFLSLDPAQRQLIERFVMP